MPHLLFYFRPFVQQLTNGLTKVNKKAVIATCLHILWSLTKKNILTNDFDPELLLIGLMLSPVPILKFSNLKGNLSDFLPYLLIILCSKMSPDVQV